MRKEIRLYNLIFPMWGIYAFGVLFPPFLLLLLLANFVVDSLVLLLLFRRLGLREKGRLYRNSIWKAWALGFLADFLASLCFILISEAVDFWDYGINVYLPYSSPPAFLFTTTAILVAGGLIYLFHRKWIWGRLGLDAAQQKKIALGMAILTAPYLMYLPSA